MFARRITNKTKQPLMLTTGHYPGTDSCQKIRLGSDEEPVSDFEYPFDLIVYEEVEGTDQTLEPEHEK
jgi:hypothetical protein